MGNIPSKPVVVNQEWTNGVTRLNQTNLTSGVNQNITNIKTAVDGIIDALGGPGADPKNFEEITWADLKALRDTGQLVPGKQYRITDYVTTCANNAEARSAGHPFDVIVTADSKSVLSEDARAALHEGDTYFGKVEMFADWMPGVTISDIKFKAFLSGSLEVTYADEDEEHEVMHDTAKVITELTKLTNPDGIEAPAMFNPAPDGDTAQDVYYVYIGVFTLDDVTYDLWQQYSQEDSAFESSYYITNKLVDLRLGSITSTLSSWILKYSLDNDSSRFAWADPNGKGVIYYMKDEWGNECPYDFKNIQFKRYKVTECEKVSNLIDTYLGLPDVDDYTIDSDDFIWCYTFTAYDREKIVSGCLDLSLLLTKKRIKSDNGGDFECAYNVIKSCYTSEDDYSYEYGNSRRLNNIVMLNVIRFSGGYSEESMCSSNIFDEGCSFNTLSSGCYSNSFDTYCSYNIFGDRCHFNVFGNECSSNIFDNDCATNTFDSLCVSNIFVSGCSFNYFKYHSDHNTFANNCDRNALGYYCVNNALGKNCSDNTFGNGCNHNTFDYSCKDNILGFGCSNNSFGHDCKDNNFGSSSSNNTFGYSCNSNTFGDQCSNNTFGHDFSSGIFGNTCMNNTFGDVCYHNIFGDTCQFNTFGDQCQSNTLGISCSNNVFCDRNDRNKGCKNNILGDNCSYNTFGDYCQYNTFVSSCYNNIIGSVSTYNAFDIECRTNILGANCTSNHFGVKCSHNTIGSSSDRMFVQNCIFDNGVAYISLTSSDAPDIDNYIQNVHLHLSVKGASSSNPLVISVPRNLPYETEYYLDNLGNLTVSNFSTRITWSELKALRDSSKLVPGKQYRITDYVTTTAEANTRSAGHQFDIIVKALSADRLSEEAYAILHEGDTYFANSNLSAWKLWYSIDNDSSRFAWADATNGKGVIYYMKDEFNNEAPYDFKNIVNIRWKTKVVTQSNINDLDVINLEQYFGPDYYDASNLMARAKAQYKLIRNMSRNNIQNVPAYLYTRGVTGAYERVGDLDETLHNFLTNGENYSLSDDDYIVAICYDDNEGVATCYMVVDTSEEYELYTFGNGTIDSSGAISNIVDSSLRLNNENVYGNSIGVTYNGTTLTLSENVFIGNNCYSNTFSKNCYSNIFGNDCYSNTFGDYCYSNTFGNNCRFNAFSNNCFSNTFSKNCYSNIFGNDCFSNTFGDYCYSNTFGNYCNSNTFGDNCNSNIFGNNCNSNIFGNYCYSNAFSNDCNSNIFGNSCNSNIFGNNCYSNTFGDYCKYNTFINDCYSNTFGNDCNFNRIGDEVNNQFEGYASWNIFENGVSYVALESDGSTPAFNNILQNVTIHQGVKGASSSNMRTIAIDRNLAYSTDYYANGSKYIILD